MSTDVCGWYLPPGVDVEGDGVLHKDLRRLGVTHSGLATLDTTVLGPVVVQVVSIRDVALPKGRGGGDGDADGGGGGRRLLRVRLTDGLAEAVGFEYKPVPELSMATPPGTKLRLTRVGVRRGLLVLTPACVEVLGGHVVRDGWEVAAGGVLTSTTGPLDCDLDGSKVQLKQDTFTSFDAAPLPPPPPTATAAGAGKPTKKPKPKPRPKSRKLVTLFADVDGGAKPGRVLAGVASVELVEPFRPDIDPEPQLVFGLTDAGGQRLMANAHNTLAMFLLGAKTLLSTTMATGAGNTAVQARMGLLQKQFVGQQAVFELTPPPAPHAFPVVANVGAPPSK